MIKGDIVKHSNYSGRLRILRITEHLVTLEEIDKPMVYKAGSEKMDYNHVISVIDHLELIENEPEKGQLKMF